MYCQLSKGYDKKDFNKFISSKAVLASISDDWGGNNNVISRLL